MKNVMTIVLCLFTFAAFAQMEVDNKIVLTGAGADAKVEGIKDVSGAQDAVSAEVLQSNALTYAAASGSSNAYAVSLAPATGGYTTGQVVHFLANHAATGAATLDVDGLGAVSIKKNFDQDLAADDIKSGQLVSVIYDGTNFQMISQVGNASAGGGGGGGDNTLIYTTNGF